MLVAILLRMFVAAIAVVFVWPSVRVRMARRAVLVQVALDEFVGRAGHDRSFRLGECAR
jgi:hypothetical protein